MQQSFIKSFIFLFIPSILCISWIFSSFQEPIPPTSTASSSSFIVEGRTRREKLNSLYKLYNSINKSTTLSKGIKKRIRLEEGADEAEELGKLRVIHKPKSLITLPRDTTIVSMPKVTAVSPRPRNLRGRIIIDQTPLTWKQLVQKKFASRLKGGHLKLQGKKQTESRRQRVAIIIPYRNRDSHFRVLLRYLHPLLQRQNLVEYTIYIVEQKNKLPFNRALLINIGFAEAMKIHPFDCLIFHDVDLIPEDDRNLYNCAAQPKHMSVAVSSFDYKLPYTDIFGGVGAVFSNQFKAINGMSNCFFGWGGEDDDLRNRLTEKAYRIVRPSETIARYTMLTHDQQFRSHERFKLLYSGFERFSKDGLNSFEI